jgi:hypothetical protein
MSTAVAVASLTDERNSWVAGDKYFALGNLAISASPATYVTGGIPCNLLLPLLKAQRTPLIVTVSGIGGGGGGTLFIYVYVPGVDASTGLLKIFEQSAATSGLTEISSGAIPADVSGDTITFYAIFTGQN